MMIKLKLKTILFTITFLFVVGAASSVFAATHTYTFDTKGGTPVTIDPITKEDGEELNIPTVTKSGATFGGWYYEDESIQSGEALFDVNQAKEWHPATLNLYAKWITAVDTINITVSLPVGTSVSAGSLSESAVTVPSGAKYAAFPEGAGIIKGYDDDSAYVGTIEEGKEYYVELWVSPNGGAFTSSTTIKVNGTSNYKIGDFYVDADGKLNPSLTNYGFLLYAKVMAGETTSSSEESSLGEVYYTFLDNTANQSYKIGKNDTLTVRASGEFEKFVNVEVDGVIVDPSNYTAKSGSTIITFNKDYLGKLKVGKHTVKVNFTDGYATTNFTISKSKNPATGDNVTTYIGIALASLVSIGGTLTVKRFVK